MQSYRLMSELQIAEDGRYLGGDIPFGYSLWGDRLIEVPAELDAAVSAIRLVNRASSSTRSPWLCAATTAWS